LNRKTQRLLLGAVILVAATAIAGLLAVTLRHEPPKREVDDRALLVDVMDLNSTTVQFEVRSQGTVLPRTQTVLSAEISGAIVEISPKFIAGGVFQPDEVLMRIDPTDYRVSVKKAQALLKQRQIEFDGAEKLRSQGYRAEAEFASAAAALASAEADVVRAKRNLERTYIKLPYEGMVLSKDADIGQFVTPGTRLGVTFATNYAEVRLPLTDQDLAFVELPDAAEITGTGGADGPAVTLAAVQKGQPVEWQAKVVRSEGVVDEKSRVSYAVAQIDDPYRLHTPGTPLPVGTFVGARIEGSAVDGVIRVPRSALRGSNQLLLVDDENKIRIQTVSVVRADAQFAYVAGDELIGERIATTGIDSPLNGMLVRTTDDAQAEDSDSDQVAVRSEEE
jgi:RND family efflux transporter MFP subunit